MILPVPAVISFNLLPTTTQCKVLRGLWSQSVYAEGMGTIPRNCCWSFEGFIPESWLETERT